MGHLSAGGACFRGAGVGRQIDLQYTSQEPCAHNVLRDAALA